MSSIGGAPAPQTAFDRAPESKSELIASESGVVRPSRQRFAYAGWWILSLAAGALHLWSYRYNIADIDGISYLDMGDAYLRGDWNTAINGYWSPLYGIIQSLALKIARPSAYWQYPFTQIVNLLLFVLSIASFEFLLRQLEHYRRVRVDAMKSVDGAATPELLPSWAIRWIAWPLFIWSALYWQFLWLLSPDVLLSAIIYTLGGLILRAAACAASKSDDARLGIGSWGTFIAMGVMLGIGYLTKAAMAPLAAVFVATALLSSRRGARWATAMRGIVTLIIFVAIAAPLVTALSMRKGRFTTGDAGRINYAWYVTGATQDWPHWQGQPPRTGKAAHPARKLSNDPVIYEFATPVGGSYPMWYDPSYWHEGIRAPIKWSYIKSRLKRSLEWYRDFLTTNPQPVLWSVAIIVGALALRRPRDLKMLATNWPLALPAIAAMGLYSLVHLRERYLGPFAVLLWIALFGAVRLPAGIRARIAQAACVAAGAAVLIYVAGLTARDWNRPWERTSVHSSIYNWTIADALSSYGVRAGHRVGVIGDGMGSSRWARLAEVRVIAEIPYWDKKRFWSANAARQAEILQQMRDAGCHAVVADNKPSPHTTAVWEALGDTGYFVHRFDR